MIERLLVKKHLNCDIEAVYALNCTLQDGLSSGRRNRNAPHSCASRNALTEKTHINGDSVDVGKKVVRPRMMYAYDWLQLRFVGSSAWTSITEAVCLFVRHAASVAGGRGHASRLHRVLDEGVQL